jgi:hypothetical protein
MLSTKTHLNSALYAQILPYLPPTLQDLLLNPPSLSNPRSLWPIARALIPYTQYIIVLVAFYIVWTTMRGIAGYFTRFMRFSLKLGPILALVGWLMANSGQGGMDELFQAIKEYTGLAQPQPPGRPPSPGIANLFGQAGAKNGRRSDPVSGRTRAKSTKAKGKTANSGSGLGDAGDILASMLNSATGTAGTTGKGDEWQDYVKDFVKNSLVKASGLEWLLGTNDQEGRGAGRTR